MNIENDSWAVGNGYNRVNILKAGWTEGEVVTPWGFVCCYAQGNEDHFYITKLEFIKDGRCYVRTFRGKRYTPRGIKTKAMEFAKEIAMQAND